MKRLALFLVVGLSLLPTAAAAQEPPELRPGAVVRVWTSPESAPLIGTLLAQDGTSLTLVRKGFDKAVSVTPSTITRIDVSRGRRSRGRAVLSGVLIGAGTAFVLGLMSGDDPPNEFLAFTGPEKGLILSILTVPAGAIVGAIVGPGPERWATVTTPSKGSLLVAPASPSFRLTLRF